MSFLVFTFKNMIFSTKKTFLQPFVCRVGFQQYYKRYVFDKTIDSMCYKHSCGNYTFIPIKNSTRTIKQKSLFFFTFYRHFEKYHI